MLTRGAYKLSRCSLRLQRDAEASESQEFCATAKQRFHEQTGDQVWGADQPGQWWFLAYAVVISSGFALRFGDTFEPYQR